MKAKSTTFCGKLQSCGGCDSSSCGIPQWERDRQSEQTKRNEKLRMKMMPKKKTIDDTLNEVRHDKGRV